MPEWLAIVLAIFGGTGILTLICKDIYNWIKTSSKKARERIKKEKQEDMREVIREEVEPLGKKIDAIDIKLDKVENGTLSSLRNDILTCYYRCKEKGYRNDYDFQNIHHLWEAYDDLHGNSFIADIMNRFDHLPVKEDVKDIDTHIIDKKSNKRILNEKKGE